MKPCRALVAGGAAGVLCGCLGGLEMCFVACERYLVLTGMEISLVACCWGHSAPCHTRQGKHSASDHAVPCHCCSLEAAPPGSWGALQFCSESAVLGLYLWVLACPWCAGACALLWASKPMVKSRQSKGAGVVLLPDPHQHLSFIPGCPSKWPCPARQPCGEHTGASGAVRWVLRAGRLVGSCCSLLDPSHGKAEAAVEAEQADSCHPAMCSVPPASRGPSPPLCPITKSLCSSPRPCCTHSLALSVAMLLPSPFPSPEAGEWSGGGVCGCSGDADTACADHQHSSTSGFLGE